MQQFIKEFDLGDIYKQALINHQKKQRWFLCHDDQRLPGIVPSDP